MQRFFKTDHRADSFANAEDKDAWVAESLSEKHDWSAPLTNEAPPANAGSMCPVEHGGLTVDHLDHQITTVYYGTA